MCAQGKWWDLVKPKLGTGQSFDKYMEIATSMVEEFLQENLQQQ